MKKKVVCLIMILLVLMLATIAIIRINREEDNGLTKITVADATITSLTLMII